MEKQPKPDALDRALTDLYRSDIPTAYRANWRTAVQREERQTMQKHRQTKTFWRIALPAAAALVLVVGALSAGNLIPTITYETLNGAPAPKAASQSAYEGISLDGAPENGDVRLAMAPQAEYAATASEPMQDADNDMAAGSAARGAGTTADTAAQSEAGTKIVRTADLTLATTRYDADVTAVQALAEKLGGYVASVSLSGEPSQRMDRTAYLSLRVPSDQLDAFLTGLEGIGRIVSRYETATDMSTQYADTSMRLATQREKMTRLTELLKQAADVSDLLEIESEIADTQYEIDALESSLRTIDRDATKSAVTVSLQEQSAGDTAQAVTLTLWQRVGGGFEASIKWLAAFGQNVLVFLAMLLPVLVPLAALLALAVLARRAWRRAHPRADAGDRQAPAASPAQGKDAAQAAEPPADGRK